MNKLVLSIIIMFPVLFWCCGASNNQSDTERTLIEEFHENGNLRYRGYLNSLNQKDSFWIYRTIDNKFGASGNYESEFKIGDWEYGVPTYNGTNVINWERKKAVFVNISIPKDCSFEITQDGTGPLAVLHFGNGVSGSVIVVKSSNSQLNANADELIKKNQANSKYALLERTIVEINKKKGIRLLQKVELEGKDFYSEQYLISSTQPQELILLNFHSPYLLEELKSRHQVFSEIAFSIRFDSI